jgi:DsbC/DsbD-like thiol-disulfide interchange protein
MTRALVSVLVIAHSLAFSALAQSGPPQPVQWRASLVQQGPVSAGASVAIDLSGAIEQGWHVYALTEPAGGPIPLKVSLDNNDVAAIHGQISGTDPIKKHDQSFQLETQFYQGNFTLRVPLAVAASSTGKQSIPLSVRFQACSDRTCLPPRTIHLPVSIEVAPGGKRS